MLPDAAKDGLGFLYFFTASAEEIAQIPSKSDSRPPPIGKQELLDATIHANSSSTSFKEANTCLFSEGKKQN